ncbi:MAG: helix-turn-helix transcriptional regulator [Bacteroidota bacterium]
MMYVLPVFNDFLRPSLLLFFFTLAFLPLDAAHEKRSKDSLIAIAKNKLRISESLTGTAHYPEAYDLVWEVLTLADSIKNDTLKYNAYKRIAMLYSIFHQNDKALAYVDSMFQYFKPQRIRESIGMLYTAAVINRMSERYPEANDLLDKGLSISDSLGFSMDKKTYLLTEKAHIHTLNGELEKAEQILGIISRHMSPESAFASIYLSVWGDLYKTKGESKKALVYYMKSLKAIANHETRIGLKVELLEKVSKINQELGNYQLALEQINESKKLGDQLFGGRSQRNADLFQIKDSYRKAVVDHQRIQREQQVRLLQAEKDQLYQRFTYSVILLITLVLVAILVFRSIRRKHRFERQLERTRTDAQLEVKKKELAVTALQLMEKDKLLEEVKNGLEKVQKEERDPLVAQIKRTIKTNSTKTWEAFEARFVQINSSFYESLKTQHPDLSPAELKLCALIKLNFSSKEMAQLLGISADSINKARYRLRKKLDLKRDENLVTYVNNV